MLDVVLSLGLAAISLAFAVMAYQNSRAASDRLSRTLVTRKPD